MLNIGGEHKQPPIWCSPMRLVDSPEQNAPMPAPGGGAQKSPGLGSYFAGVNMQLAFTAWKGALNLSKLHKALHQQNRARKKRAYKLK